MGKGKSKSSAAPKNASGPRQSLPQSSKGGRATISDELRQAVADLGGDDEDLDLIAGVDNDEGDEPIVSSKPGQAMNEVGFGLGMS